jgi:hypothetical protein
MEMTEIKRIDFNWCVEGERVGALSTQKEKFDSFELGKDSVTGIEDIGGFFRVYFEPGRYEDIYNPNRIQYGYVDNGEKK